MNANEYMTVDTAQNANSLFTERAQPAAISTAKFAVLTTNRSGSVWVMSTLNNFPNVVAQGELFLPRPRSQEKRWDSDFACPRYIESRTQGLSVRPFAVYAYLSNLYSAPSAVGFKLMYAQLGRYPEILTYFIRHGIRVVHLVRQNHLDVLISYAIKAKLGRAHLLSGQAAPGAMQVSLPTQNLVKRLAWLERKQQIARFVLRWSRLAHMEVSYEQLVQGQAHYQRIFTFLSLRPEDFVPVPTVAKIRSGGQCDVLTNYAAVKETLANTRFAALLQ